VAQSLQFRSSAGGWPRQRPSGPTHAYFYIVTGSARIRDDDAAPLFSPL
jgi:hypothetical protein